jgi:hypothetical protein
MNWETLYNFIVYNQTIIPNAKSIEKYTYCVVTHTISQEKKNGFLHTNKTVLIWYSGVSKEKRISDFQSFEQAQHSLCQTQ